MENFRLCSVDCKLLDHVLKVAGLCSSIVGKYDLARPRNIELCSSTFDLSFMAASGDQLQDLTVLEPCLVVLVHPDLS
jgi:hypothetical protein